MDAQVRDRLSGFGDRDRVIDLVLRDAYGLSSAEIAERSDRGTAAVRTRNWETRNRLRTSLDDVRAVVVGLATWHVLITGCDARQDGFPRPCSIERSQPGPLVLEIVSASVNALA